MLLIRTSWASPIVLVAGAKERALLVTQVQTPCKFYSGGASSRFTSFEYDHGEEPLITNMNEEQAQEPSCLVSSS